jgi:signal transduction histidine kinase
MLVTILRNLVGNAVKYSSRGDSVLVACRRRGRQVAVEVRDRGAGIPADRLASIFDPFDRGTRDGGGGMGLGLHIVRQTAEMLGHRLEVRSAPGVGSTFTVLVPCPELCRIAGPQRSSLSAQGGRRSVPYLRELTG